MTLVQDLQVLHDVNGPSAEDVLRSGVEGLGEDEVCVGMYADDQWIGGEDGLHKVHLTPNIVEGGDKGHVLIASVMNKTGRKLVHIMAQSIDDVFVKSHVQIELRCW
jgi:hypothetical protein